LHPQQHQGLVRAFDIRTASRSAFDTIPRPGQPATRPGRTIWAITACRRLDAYQRRSGDWPRYLPCRDTDSDYYGGIGRATISTLKARRRRYEDRVRKWHFQFVHHPLWNWDMTSRHSRRHHRQWPRGQGGCGRPQARLALCVRSRDRTAGVADRGRPVPQSDVRARRQQRRSRIRRTSCNTPQLSQSPEDLIDFTPEIGAKAMRCSTLQGHTSHSRRLS